MNGPRRLSLQLTSLFDLMLIVIFAQYLSVRLQEETRATEVARLRTEAEQALAALQQSEARQQSLGEAVVRLFNVPELDVAEALIAAEQRDPVQRAQLAARFEALAQQQAAATIEHILTYEEIRKRCDLWNLHIEATGQLLLQTNDESPRAILQVSAQGLDKERLGSELFSQYKQLPEQKSLVLILLTYDRAARLQLIRQVRELLPEITARMQADAGGRSRYDFADLGFRDVLADR